ncbi:apiosidase-like domain-containing protein [Microlunatus soli]|uniref:Apiosidase-like catalytic domain-containing protein n=1 Tax=Microlunatus soli TaxID=630515 RepID=A0A1H1YLE5_9ACTN|nr:DUF4038 domain-containing protein [Microlunatus soli]SDT22252.1 Protein of unknown function [Microlunatus soli]
MLTVAPSGRWLERDHDPWFLLGDTAWELFHRLDLDDADHYLRTRAEQGFNTVFAVGVAEFGGLDEPNANGQVPFIDRRPDQPDERYWHHVDTIITMANQYGLVVALLPTWGTYWADAGEAILHPGNAAQFGSWIAARYRDSDLIWVLGGDRYIETSRHRATLDALAKGIRETVGHRQLITVHPRGHASSKNDLSDATWIDFDLVQSGHVGWHTPNDALIAADYDRPPLRPVLEGEPNYEDHPVMTPDWLPVPGWVFGATDVRRSLYHAIFAGAAGFVYGANGVYQMLDSDTPDPVHGRATSWRAALDLPGASQATHGAHLLRELGPGWTPAPHRLRSAPGFLSGRVMVLDRNTPTEVLVYLPPGATATIDTEDLGCAPSGRWWSTVTGRWRTADLTAQPTTVNPDQDVDTILHIAARPA